MFHRSAALRAATVCVAAMAALLVPAIAPANAAKKVAVVLGVRDYVRDPLHTPLADKRLLTEALKGAGFDVLDTPDNPDRKQIIEAAQRLAGELDANSTGLFYFAGHGGTIENRGHLFGRSSPQLTSDHIDGHAVTIDEIQTILAPAQGRANIIYLAIDACRGDSSHGGPPQSGLRGGVTYVQPFAEQPERGYFLAFSSQPGQPAADRVGGADNSPYAHGFDQGLRRPETEDLLFFHTIERYVVTTSLRAPRQEPKIYKTGHDPRPKLGRP